MAADVEVEARHLPRLFRRKKRTIATHEDLPADHHRLPEVGVDHHQGLTEERIAEIAPETTDDVKREADRRVDQSLLRHHVVEVVMIAEKIVVAAQFLDARVTMLVVVILPLEAAVDPGHQHKRRVALTKRRIATVAVIAGRRCDRLGMNVLE